MKEIHKNLFIGNDLDCMACINNPEFVIIHACKTCHQKKIGYSKSLPATHSNYLILKTENNLYLNLVDMVQEFQPNFTNPIIECALNFIAKNIVNKKILIHCNQGVSRSASIGMIYLSDKEKSYESVVAEFRKLYPNYNPGMGIELYMKNNWDYLMRLKSNLFLMV